MTMSKMYITVGKSKKSRFATEFVTRRQFFQRTFFKKPKEKTVIIAVAINTPRMEARTVFFFSICSMDAITQPVQAPVPGSGIPMNNTSPQKSYFSILALCLSTLLSTKFATEFKNLIFERLINL